jgi:pimeloyl-ACP methyl ester carboxylesterase
VVLAHEYPASLCGWWPYANYLAKRGFHVLLFDFRCFGESACPTGAGHWNLTADLQAASDQLRMRGATSVSLVGASLGGAAVLVAGSKVTPPPASVVELSGEPDLGNIGYPYEAGQAVRDLPVPVLFVVARGDSAVTVGETRTMFRNAPSRDKRLVVLPSTAGHGWTMLTNGLLNWSAMAARVADFVRAHGMK